MYDRATHLVMCECCITQKVHHRNSLYSSVVPQYSWMVARGVHATVACIGVADVVDVCGSRVAMGAGAGVASVNA